MGLPLRNPTHVAAGVANVSRLVRKKILNLAAASMGGGQFRPLIDSDQLSQRDLRLIAQAEYLIKHRNDGRNALPPNWPTLVHIWSISGPILVRFCPFSVLFRSIFGPFFKMYLHSIYSDVFSKY